VQIVKDALGALASVLFPAPCRICGQPLTNARRIPLCETCLAGFVRIIEPMCPQCGRPSDLQPGIEAGARPCRLCRLGFYAFDRARSFAVYDDALLAAVVLLKYEEVTRLGNWFADRLEEVLRESPEEWRKIDAVVPVPLHPDRRRERGYNQAELIARPLAVRIGAKLVADALQRVKPRPPHLILSRSERWKSVRGAYVAGPSALARASRVLLVDDVFTTGATLDSCARELKRAGAASVFGLTVGRVRLSAVNAAGLGSRLARASQKTGRANAPSIG